MRVVLAAVVLAGCASGSARLNDVPADAEKTEIDARVLVVDAPGVVDGPAADAHPDATVAIDAPPPADAAPLTPDASPDAFVCTSVVSELLLSPTFDLEPLAVHWTEVRVAPGYEII